MYNHLKIRRNLKLLPIYSFFIECRFIAVVAILFYAHVAGSYALGMSIFSVSLFATALLEVPTGIFSDKIGRKNTMILATLCDVCSMSLYIAASIYNSYLILVIAAFFNGAAGSLYSGTETALLYETLADLRKTNKYHEVSGKMESMMQMASAVAAFIGSFIAYKYSYTFLSVISVVPIFLAFLTTLFFVEPKQRNQDEKDISSLKHFIEAFRILLKNKKLLALSVGSIISTSFGNSSHRFQVAYFETLIPVWLIGFVRGLKQLGGFFGAWFAGKFIDKFSHYKVITIGTIANSLIKISALAINSVVTPFIFSTLNFLYSPVNIAVSHLMQNEFSDKQRATMGSIVSVFGSILYGVISIAVGYVADITSPLIALWCLLLPEFVVFAIYYKTLKKNNYPHQLSRFLP